MTPVLSRAQMREFDRRAIEVCRVPSLVLMENAGRGATEVLVREALEGSPVGARAVVVCGTGNNGGDGLVVARRLAVLGAMPEVFLVGDESRVSNDAKSNLDAWVGLGGGVRTIRSSEDVGPLEQTMNGAAVVVDALFGTGLDRAIEGLQARVVGAVNACRTHRFAVDLPSGLDADTGAVLAVAVQAHTTVTFAHWKLGLLTPSGSTHGGRLHVVDIGVPSTPVLPQGHAYLLTRDDLKGWQPPRAGAAHKNSAGHVVILGGSPGRIGAPQLVARGAMRAGAGLATIATWPDAAGAIEGHVLEVMTARLDPSNLAQSVDRALAHKQAVVLGPGFGLGTEARSVVEHVLSSWGGPLVVDADALSAFAGRPSVFRAGKNVIVTPHPGEMARLLGGTSAEVEADRFGAARRLVAASGAVVVLKGAHTIVASPDGRLAVAPIVCPVLATAGAGDVLAGIIGALACRLPAFEAACAGVMLHGLAGEAWSRQHANADRGMLASEIAEGLPALSSEPDA